MATTKTGMERRGNIGWKYRHEDILVDEWIDEWIERKRERERLLLHQFDTKFDEIRCI